MKQTIAKPKTLDQVGRVSTRSVRKGTGKDWIDWISIMNKAGARSWSHREMVAFLKKKYRLTQWWQQIVAHGFEVASGIRVDGQNSKGLYQVTSTKTIKVDSKKIWKFLTSKKGLAVWLKPLSPTLVKVGKHFETADGFFGEFRTLKAPVRLRMSWKDPNWAKPTVLQIYCVARVQGNSILAFQHDGLKDSLVQAQMRRRWKRVVADIASAL